MRQRDNVIKSACRERSGNELKEMATYRNRGGKVLGHTCHAFPSSVAAGLGLWPVRVLCGASSASESSGGRLVREDICPLVKSMMGNIYEKKGLHSAVDIWAGLYTCDHTRRAFQTISALGIEVHPVQLPQTRTDEAARYFASQIRRLVSDIEMAHGLSFDANAATMWKEEQTAASNALKAATLSGAVSPLDLHEMFSLFNIARPHELKEFYEEIIAESKPFDGKYSVVVTGSPLALEDTALLEFLETRNVSAIPLNCSGLNAVEESAGGASGDFIEDAALKSFNLPPCMRARPNKGVYERIRETVSVTNAAGVIVKSLKFCDSWYTEKKRLETAFDVPVLVFDSTYGEGERERMEARLEAFLEVIGRPEILA